MLLAIKTLGIHVNQLTLSIGAGQSQTQSIVSVIGAGTLAVAKSVQSGAGFFVFVGDRPTTNFVDDFSNFHVISSRFWPRLSRPELWVPWDGPCYG
jgi:hypothetical protein